MDHARSLDIITGQSIALTIDRRLVRRNATGRADTVTLTRGDGYPPRWAPDGTRLYFLGRGDRAGNAFTVRADGTDERSVTNFTGRSGTIVPNSLATDGNYLYFSWQEDLATSGSPNWQDRLAMGVRRWLLRRAGMSRLRGSQVPLVLGLLVLVQAGIGAQGRGARALDAPRSIGYFIGAGDSRASYTPADRQLAEWAIETWQRAAGAALKLTPALEASARVRLYWAGPNGGQYGEMRPLVADGHAGAAVFIRPDTTALGPDIAALADADPLLRDTIVYLTCVHELGHALGLAHTADFRDIMYSFLYGGDIVEYFSRYRRQLRTRADIARVSGLSDEDITRIRRLYPER